MSLVPRRYAASRGWHALVAPGILVGLFGYAIGTFIGVSIAAMLGVELAAGA